MTISFKNQTITVIRPTEWYDERGDLFPNWDTAAEHDITRCRLQPMASDEVHFTGSDQQGGTARSAIITRWRLFTPANPDLGAHDRVRHAGEVYEIDGQVQDWPSPTGVLTHSEVVLRRVEG